MCQLLGMNCNAPTDVTFSFRGFAHIRKATQGRVALESCHPFVRELWGRYRVFAHNGNLLDFSPRLHGSVKPVGSIDSERAFCWLMQELTKSHADLPNVQELSITLRELAAQIARHGTFNLDSSVDRFVFFDRF